MMGCTWNLGLVPLMLLFCCTLRYLIKNLNQPFQSLVDGRYERVPGGEAKHISLDSCMCLRLTLIWSIGSFPHSWMLWFPECGFLFVSKWYLGILGWCYDFLFGYVSVLRAGAVCQWSVPTLGTWRSCQRHPALRALVTPQMAPRLCSSTSHLSVYRGTPEVTIGWYNSRQKDDVFK